MIAPSVRRSNGDAPTWLLSRRMPTGIGLRKDALPRRRGVRLIIACLCLLIAVYYSSVIVYYRSKGTDTVLTSPSSQGAARLFEEKLLFRKDAVEGYDRGGGNVDKAERIDEVIYSIQSYPDSAQCNANLLKELFASALSLKQKCVRCDFDIVLVADEPIYSFLMAENNAKNVSLFSVFDRLERQESVTRKDPAKAVFASRKPDDLLNYSRKPFVVFMDADVYSNHRAVPESIFDMLHKEYDVIMPTDWAHRHGDLWGRGVPGLCTCLIGFINHQSVRGLIEDWKRNIDRMESADETDPKRVEWERLMRFDRIYQHRDQELLSITLHENVYPHIKLFALSLEWVCANTDKPTTMWTEGTSNMPGGPFASLTSNPCKALHSHHPPRGAYDTFTSRQWIQTLTTVGIGGSDHDGSKCGGARRIPEKKSGEATSTVHRT